MPPENEPFDNPDPDDESPHIRQLRQKAKRADELEPEVEQLRSRVAFIDAGVPSLTEKQRAAVLAANGGDTSPEAILATSSEFGWYTPPEEPAQTPPDERAAHQRIEAAAAGASPAGGKPELLDKIRSAGSEAEYWAAVNEAGLVNQEGQVFSPRI